MLESLQSPQISKEVKKPVALQAESYGVQGKNFWRLQEEGDPQRVNQSIATPSTNKSKSFASLSRLENYTLFFFFKFCLLNLI